MATTDAPTPIPGRASDAERRRIARLLQERSTQGRLSRDTFAARVERALTARSRAELDDLVADVRRPGPVRRAAIASIGWLSTLTADVQSAWQAGRMPVLALPAHPTRPTTMPFTRVPLLEPRSRSSQPPPWRRTWAWRRETLGSVTTQSHSGERRVTEATDVRPGDHISLGGVRYRLASR